MAQERLYTIDDIYALPDERRAELIDGQIYYMAPPSRKHQRITGEIFAAIREYIDTNNGTCEVDIAPFAVFLNKVDKNYVEPEKDRILVYDFASEKTGDYTFSDTVKAGIYKDFYIDFAAITSRLHI